MEKEIIKTTFRIPNEIIKELKHLSIDEGKTVTDLLIEALTEYLNKKRKSKK